MARVRSGRERRRARWITGALVAVLAVAVILLSVLAIVRTQRAAEPVAATPRPVPSITVQPTTTRSPTSTPAAAAPAATPPGAAERFLSVGPGAMWRATAGQCGTTEPLLERSTDDGASWQDVTPRYLGIGQILSLDAFADTEAQMVVLTGPGCELQALRTFTQGRFWEPYPDVLAASTYVDPANPGTVVIAGSAVSTPCPTPWGVRAASATVGLICDGTAYERVDGTWTPIAEGALAITADAAGVTAAAIRADCTGVWITDSDAGSCLPTAQPDSPLALTDGMLWLATGDLLRTSP